jgi:ubiquinone/menaquinone biosynthesis C-methylase UbiE
MVWSSKAGKIGDRERLLDLLQWTGNERVLDLGCGRGLMLIGAARRLTTGKASGVDIWQAEDLSGNKPEATLENARREGVGDRVSIETADMRKLPFPDGTFDVVVSRAAVHNIYSAGGRAEAISEVARVLKPGGHAIIDDIRHLGEYRETFARHGCTDAGPAGSLFVSLILIVLTMGSLRPGVVHVKKSAA